MNPSAYLKNGAQLIIIGLGARWDQLVKAFDNALQSLFEFGQRAGDILCSDAEDTIDVNLNFFEAWFSAKCADVRGIRDVEIVKRFCLPAPRGLHTGHFEPSGGRVC